MIIGIFQKQPAERLDYDLDYVEWHVDGDTVVSATVAVAPAGLTIESHFVNDPFVKVWVSGGTHGATYKVTVTATTSGGRIKQDEFKIKVKDI